MAERAIAVRAESLAEVRAKLAIWRALAPGAEDGDLRTPRNRLILSVEADLERLSRGRLTRGRRRGAAAPVRDACGSAPSASERDAAQDAEAGSPARERRRRCGRPSRATSRHGGAADHLPAFAAARRAGQQAAADERGGFSRGSWSRATSTSGLPRQPDARRSAGAAQAGLLGRGVAWRGPDGARAGVRRGVPAAGLGDGVGIPVYGPNGRGGQCGLGFGRGAAARAAGPAGVPVGLPARAPALLRADPATLGPRGGCRGARPRCWRGWRAARATALIGEILGISAHTVDAHLRRICPEARASSTGSARRCAGSASAPRRATRASTAASPSPRYSRGALW